jgi:hypothetical protein
MLKNQSADGRKPETHLEMARKFRKSVPLADISNLTATNALDASPRRTRLAF